MNKPILSICIPTYNRSGYLRDALLSIQKQLDQSLELKEEIEVVVADNNSPDNTESVVREFVTSIPNLVYIKNPENVGFDKNVDIVVRGARSEYCWYLGDDDTIENGALSHMVKVCRTEKYAVIGMDSRPLYERPILNSEKVSYSDNDHIDGLSSSEAYIQGHLPSALSMLAFRKNDWVENANFSEHTPGWYYFETILKIAAKPKAAILYIKKPMVLTGQDMRWADGGAGLKIFIDCNRFLHKMIDDWGYDKKTIAAELRNNARRFPIVLMQSKVKGLPISGRNFALVHDFTKDLTLANRLVSETLFFVPNPLIRFLHTLKKMVRGSRNVV